MNRHPDSMKTPSPPSSPAAEREPGTAARSLAGWPPAVPGSAPSFDPARAAEILQQARAS